jgi:hypothetical protein
MGYYIDLEKISLDDYRGKLESAYLPPSRRILKERINERLGYFKTLGIKNLKELVQLLKKKEKLAELSEIKCFSGNYLIILLRELNSTLPKPNKIKDFSGISESTAGKLKLSGIKNTEHLYEKVVKESGRRELARLTGIDEKEILELTKLSDLSRIKWVGVTFARMLYAVGIDTAEKASKADPVELHAMINRLNREKNIYKGQIGLNDIRIFVDAAKEVSFDIEY